jgi:RimJ/RimL family protein N-acetyltransferase
MMMYPYRFYTKDGLQVVIRAAVPGDARAFVASLNSVCQEGIFLLHEFSPKTVEGQEAMIRMLDQNKNLIAVVELNGIVMGGMAVFVGGMSPKARHFCELGIHLVKAARGRGVGSKMLEYTIEWSRQRGYRKICLSVFSSNHRAIHLYRKYGFIEEGRRRDQYLIGNSYVDEVLMSKFLYE